MTESFLDRWTRAERRRIAGIARKPEFNLEITVPVEDLQPPAEMAPLFGEAQEATPDKVVRPTVTELAIAPGVRNWLSFVSRVIGEKSVNARDLWVRIDVRPENRCVTYTTSTSSLVLAFRDPRPVHGKLRCFVRFTDFVKAVEKDGATTFGVSPKKLTYVAGGAAQELVAHDQVHSDAFVPDAPPLTGYKLVKDLGLALREASKFTKKRADAMGRHKVLLYPRNDEAGNVDVVGCGGADDEAGIALIYCRSIQIPGLNHDLYLEPLRAIEQDTVLPDNVGMARAGQDFVWLTAETGFIIGMESEAVSVPDPNDLNAALSGANGRLEFAHEEIDALRRSLAQIRLAPETVAKKEVVVRPRGQARVLEFGLPDSIQTVPCSGDMGPESISVNPDLMLHALAVHGINAIEFDRVDPERPLLMVGPGVRVALKPLEALK